MLVNGYPDVVVQAYQFPVDIQRCPILRTLDFLLDTLYQIQVLATVHQHLQILHSHETKHTFFSGYFTIQRKIKQSAFNSTNEKALQTYCVVHNGNHSCQAALFCRTASWLERSPMCVYVNDTTTQKEVFPQLIITVNRALRSQTGKKHVLRDVLFSITN